MVNESPRVEFLFDFGSPNAFLCHKVIPEIEARTGVRFDYVPVLLGGIFKATGNLIRCLRTKRSISNRSYSGLLRICAKAVAGDSRGLGYLRFSR
jgi:2-hydroxychromene-2-carboxylate isomerase